MKISKEYCKISGIYKIINKINNNCYIGSSKNIYERLHRHKTELIKNKHFNQHLQNAINKYGISNFECEILEKCDKKDINICEQKWLDLLEPHYNIMKKANKIIIEESTKLKISKTLKEGYKSGKIVSPSTIDVYIYSVFGKFISKFNSAKQACEFIGTSESNLTSMLKNVGKNFGDYIASYTLIENPINYGRKYKIIDIINNKEYQFHLIKDCAKFLKCNKKCLEYPLKNNTLYKKRYKLIVAR